MRKWMSYTLAQWKEQETEELIDTIPKAEPAEWEQFTPLIE